MAVPCSVIPGVQHSTYAESVQHEFVIPKQEVPICSFVKSEYLLSTASSEVVAPCETGACLAALHSNHQELSSEHIDWPTSTTVRQPRASVTMMQRASSMERNSLCASLCTLLSGRNVTASTSILISRAHNNGSPHAIKVVSAFNNCA